MNVLCCWLMCGIHVVVNTMTVIVNTEKMLSVWTVGNTA